MNTEGILSKLAASAQRLASERAGMLRQTERPGPDEIHEFRVTTKRLRAYWILAAPAVGRAPAKAHRTELRDAARGLAVHRDEFVMAELLATLVERVGRKRGREVVLIADELFGVGEDSAVESYDLDVSEFGRALRVDADCWAASLDKEAVATKEALVREGFERTYEKARELGKAAIVLETPASYHRWRRWVKYAYYQYAWFRSEYPDVKAGRERRLKRLGGILGRLHDAHHLLCELDERSLRTSNPKAFRRTRRSLMSLEDELIEEVKRKHRKALGREPALVSEHILEAIEAASSARPAPELEFVSLANHEGNGLASSAPTADAH
jgi:CHAD domain-containing protein